MEIKVLKEENYLESLKLSEYAFQYEVAPEDVEGRLEKLTKHHILGIYENEQELAAKLHILPLKVFIAGKEWLMGGIAGVATYPEFRRKGYVKELLIESLKVMKEKKQVVSFLHPFDISFYRKFGWEMIADIKNMTVSKNDLRRLKASNGHISRFKKEGHLVEIEEVYTKFAKAFSGTLVRDQYWWINHVYSNLTAAVYFNDSKEAEGYILYSVKNQQMEVHEFVSLNQEAKKNLWNFICQHDSMVEKVKFYLPAHDHLNYLLSQPKQDISSYPYFMGRIVDVESFLKDYPIAQTTGKVFLHVNDEFAPWNTATYLLNEGAVRTFREKAGSSCSHPPKKGLSLDINTLSAILLGYKRPLELYELGFISGPKQEAEELEQKIPVQKSLFYDFF